MTARPLAGKRVAISVGTEYIYDEIECYRRCLPWSLHMTSPV